MSSSSSSSSSSSLASRMRATTETLVYAFDGTWSLSAALAPRAPECKHTILPSSLQVPVRNNEEWAEYLKKVKHLILEAKMTINDYIAIPSERRAVCRSSLTATTAVGPYSNEYVWFLGFDEEGGKIVSITEFLDSKAAGELLGKFREAGLLEGH